MKHDIYELAATFLLGILVLGGWVAIAEWGVR